MDPDSLTALFVSVTDFAKAMLGSAGEFYPFGGFIDAQGQPHQLSLDTADERPDRAAVYSQVEEELRQRVSSGRALAVALVADVNIPAEYEPPLPDGIRVLIEAQGFARFFYVPYSCPPPGTARGTTDETEPKYADIIAVEIAPRFFLSRISDSADGEQ